MVIIMNTILVTGGCGFIFSNFIRYMLNKYKDYKIINFDNLTYCGRLENTENFKDNKNYKFIKGDICDVDLVNQIVKRVDVIVHGAAESFVDRSISNAENFIQTNVYGTYVLLEAAKKNNIKKFVFISTDEVYGSIEEGSFKEDSLLNPRNPYSASKTAADLLAKSYFSTYNLPVVITRSSNNFGPYQYPEKLIPLFITSLLEDKKVPLYGDGLNVRDWLYVLDNCEAIDFVMHNGVDGESYNIGGGNEITNLDITKFILKVLGKNETNIEFVKDRLGHDKRYSLDFSKIRKLGWKPKYNFNDVMNSTIRWYENNEKWWKEIKTGDYLNYYNKHYHETHKMSNNI